MSEMLANLSLTNQALKVFAESAVNPELLREVRRLKKKLENISKTRDSTPSTFMGYCLICFGEYLPENKECCMCKNWDCSNCIEEGELSPMKYTCIICHDIYCEKCYIENQGIICKTCGKYSCKFCYVTGSECNACPIYYN